jgi:hypothetical protein
MNDYKEILMTKNFFFILTIITSSPLWSQDQEVPLTQEEEYYEGYQVNPNAYPEDEYSDIERQEEEAFDYFPEDEAIDEAEWEMYEDYPQEEYPLEYAE